MNRNFIAALFGVALFMGTPLFAAVQEFIGPDGVTPIKVAAPNPLPISMSGASSSVTITGNASVVNPGVISSVLHTGTLATNSVTLISSIATLTANDIVELQVSGTSYRGPAGTASATLQAGGIKMSTDDTFTFRYNGADFALIADPAAASTYRLIVYKDR